MKITDARGGAGVSTALQPSLIQRVAEGIRYVVTGSKPTWFGPLTPMLPAAQEATEGRQFDYMPGFNLHVTPRAGELVPFDTMRQLVDNYDIMRIIIETCKDVLCEMDWQIKPIDPKGKRNRQCKAIEQFLQYPDRENDWQTWLRALLEDMLVIDAATIYPRKNLGGTLYALEYIDGATIKPVLSDSGRRPPPGEVAYQQILHGIATADYTVDELYYMPRNRRTHKVYGFSPVEQMITTVNMAIRRQLHQLQIFTDGSLPDLIFGVPATWQADHIIRFQAQWDARLKGNTAEQRGAQFVPDGVKPYNLKEQALKSEDDEWLARICCYCLGVEATPFIRQQNRSTSETVREQAIEEGKAPRARWIKNRMNWIIQHSFGAPDLEFAWEEKDPVSVLEKSQIHQIYYDIHVLDENEIRDELGMDALSDEQLAARKSAANPDPDPEDPEDPNNPDNTPKPGDKKDGKKGKEAQAIKVSKANAGGDDDDDETDDSAEVAAEELKKKEQRSNKLKLIILALLLLMKRRVSDGLASFELSDLQMLSVDELAIRMNELVTLPVAEAAKLVERLTPVLSDSAVSAAVAAMKQVGAEPSAEQLTALTAALSKSAEDRSAEMLGKKLVDGALIENPDAIHSITKTSAESLAAEIHKGLQKGLPIDEIITNLGDSNTFSDNRTKLIYATELKTAENVGILAGWNESGVVTGKISVLAEGDIHHGEDDILNAAAGITPLNDPFPSGHMAPLYHPNCLCHIEPVLGGVNNAKTNA